MLFRPHVQRPRMPAEERFRSRVSTQISLLCRGNLNERRNALNALWELVHGEEGGTLEYIERSMTNSVEALVSLLSDEDTEARKRAVWFLKRLALMIQTHSLIEETEAMQLLLDLLSDQDMSLRIEAAGALEIIFLNTLRLSPPHTFGSKKIRGGQWIKPFVSLLANEDTDTRKRATRILMRLISNEPKDIKHLEKAGGVAFLVFLLLDRDMEVRRNTTEILAMLALTSRKKRLIINAGGIAPLVSLLSYEDMHTRKRAAQTLCRLAKSARNKERIINAGAIAPLVSLLSHQDTETRRAAAATLEMLSFDHPDDEEEAEQTLPLSCRILPDDSDQTDDFLPMDSDIEDPVMTDFLSFWDDNDKEYRAETEMTTQALRAHQNRETQRAPTANLEIRSCDRAGSPVETEEVQQTSSLSSRSLSDLAERIETVCHLSSSAHQERPAEAESTTSSFRPDGEIEAQRSATNEVEHLSVHQSEHKEPIEETRQISLMPLYPLWDTEDFEGLADDIQNKEPIGEAGGVCALVSLLSDEDADIQRLAATTLRNLAWHTDNQKHIAESGGIAALVSLLSDQPEDVQRQWEQTRLLPPDPDRKTPSITEHLGKFWPKEMEEAQTEARLLGRFCLEEMESTETRKQAALVLLCLSSKTGTTDVPGEFLLSDIPSGSIRTQAAEALYHVASHHQACWLPRDTNVLLSLLSEPDVSIRRSATAALKNIADQRKTQKQIATAEGIQLLVSLLSDEDATIRADAVGALRNLSLYPSNQKIIANSGGINLLISLLSDEDTTVRGEAARALQTLACDRKNQEWIVMAGAIAPLVALMSDKDTAIRSAAVTALGCMNYRHNDHIVMAGAIAPLASLMSDKDGNIRSAALDLLYTLAVDLEYTTTQIIELTGKALLCALSDQDAWTQEIASKILYMATSKSETIEELKAPWDIQQLVPVLSHTSAFARRWAVKELTKLTCHDENNEAIAQAGGIEPLVALLSDGDTEVRKEAAGALYALASNTQNQARIAEAGGIRLLRSLQSAEDPTLRESIPQLFGDLTHDDAQEPIAQRPRL